jgi:curli biogenesis system outer membrane secretion channel CsgG
MRRFLALCLLAGFVLAAGTVSAQDKKTIVVGDPKTQWAGGKACAGYAPDYANTIASSLRSRIIETGAFKVVSREQMQKILREHEMPMTGLSDPSKAKILGQFLQADLIMATEVLCHPTSVEFIVQLVDVETAEIIYSKTYEMQDLQKVSRALKDLADLLKKYAKTGAIGESAGKTEKMMMIDSKALHDASSVIIKVISMSVPHARVKVSEVNAYDEEGGLKVKMMGGKGWAGLKFLVKRGGEEIGWLYLKESGSGELKAGATGEISSFEEGDVGSSEEFKPRVAVGFIEDEDEDDQGMIELFRKGLLEELDKAESVEAADDGSVAKLLERMGSKPQKKDLARLFEKGVDLVITGRFSGPRGSRRIDFDVLSTFDGKRVTQVKYDSKL